jgi:deoxyribonuclease-4
MAKLIGGHLSISKGLYTIQEQMENLNSKTCAFFVRNPRGFNSSPLKESDVLKFRNTVENIENLLPHAPYIFNLANKEQQEKHMLSLEDDLKKLELLGIKLYNIHPGSDVNGLGRTKALSLISENINKLKNKSVTIVIENIAGDGKKVGSTFEDLRDIIENVFYKERVGICLDTCHLFAAGYNIKTKEDFEVTMNDFKRIVGIKYLKGVHLNDSKHNLGSKKDRHEHLGKGKIGIEAFKYIMNSTDFENIPMILETPDPLFYSQELTLLRSFENKAEEL